MAALTKNRPEQVVGSVWLAWGAVIVVDGLVYAVRGTFLAGNWVWGSIWIINGLLVLFPRPPKRKTRLTGRTATFVFSVLFGACLLVIRLTDAEWRESRLGFLGAIAFIAAGTYALVADRIERSNQAEQL